MPDDSKAIAHLKVMQGMMRRYLSSPVYVAHNGRAWGRDDGADDAFITDMIYMLDGPEQRGAMAEEPVKLDCTVMFDRLDPL